MLVDTSHTETKDNSAASSAAQNHKIPTPKKVLNFLGFCGLRFSQD